VLYRASNPGQCRLENMNPCMAPRFPLFCLLAWGFPGIMAALPYSTGTGYDSVGPFCFVPLKPSK
jgi:hypothetical protein